MTDWSVIIVAQEKNL